MKKFCEYLRQHAIKTSYFENKKLKLLINEDKKIKKIKNVAKLRTIFIIHVNKEVLHIPYVISSIVYVRKLLLFFTMDLTLIIILS